MYDLFISYSSSDRQQIEPIVKAFKDQGLSVWWDQDILENDWSPVIEEAISNAKRVVAFISQNVTCRSPKNYVPAEMDIALMDGKQLVPVRVGEFRIPLLIHGMIIGKQQIFSDDFSTFLQGSGFQKVCQLFGRGDEPSPVASKNMTVSDWLDKGPSLPDLSLAIALAVAENAPLATITDFGQDLERRLEAILDQKESEPKPKSFEHLLVSRTRKLENIGALRYSITHGRLGIDIECVRYEDAQRASQLLRYVWDEFDAIHSPLVEWLNNLAKSTNADDRLRIGLMLGALARERFASVFDMLIGRWMLDDDPATRELADIALCVAVSFDKTVATAVKEIVHGLADSRETCKLRAAVEFACGFTGSLMEGFSIDTLKRVAKSDYTDFQVLDAMRVAVKNMVESAMNAADNSLFRLDKLIKELSVWAQNPDPDTPQQLPMFLFLSLMDCLPLTAPSTVDGLLSISALMTGDETRNATAAAFNAALQDIGDESFRPRETAQEILKIWQKDEDRPTKPADDPLLSLAHSIYTLSPGKRDRDRLTFIFRKTYNVVQISQPPDNFIQI